MGLIRFPGGVDYAAGRAVSALLVEPEPPRASPVSEPACPCRCTRARGRPSQAPRSTAGGCSGKSAAAARRRALAAHRRAVRDVGAGRRAGGDGGGPLEGELVRPAPTTSSSGPESPWQTRRPPAREPATPQALSRRLGRGIHAAVLSDAGAHINLAGKRRRRSECLQPVRTLIDVGGPSSLKRRAIRSRRYPHRAGSVPRVAFGFPPTQDRDGGLIAAQAVARAEPAAASRSCTFRPEAVHLSPSSPSHDRPWLGRPSHQPPELVDGPGEPASAGALVADPLEVLAGYRSTRGRGEDSVSGRRRGESAVADAPSAPRPAQQALQRWRPFGAPGRHPSSPPSPWSAGAGGGLAVDAVPASGAVGRVHEGTRRPRALAGYARRRAPGVDLVTIVGVPTQRS